MSNFESNELKPDSSDRPNAPKRKNGPTIPKINNPFANLQMPHLSRQHMMIGIGAIVLLIIILTITSSLKSTGDRTTTSTPPRDIQLTPNNVPAPDTPAVDSTLTQQPAQPLQPQEITISPVNPNATEAPVIPVDPNQQRVEIPDSVIDSLSTQQGTTQQQQTVTQTPAQPSTPPPAQQQQTTTPPAASTPTSIDRLPAGNVTLQLSGASRPDTLEAFAKKQNLSGYWVYETRREGKPWFVLIYGSYANAQEANRAIATLPAEVQAKKPWVKPIRQVQQESKLR